MFFLNEANNIAFGRFFSERMFGLRFIVASTVLSSSSFLLVVAIQSFFVVEDFSWLTFNKYQIAVVAFFFLFNLIFDYASFVQTKLFVDSARLSGSAFRALLLLGSDIIVTINIFILAFSVFLLAVIYYYIGDPINIKIVIPVKEVNWSSSIEIPIKRDKDIGLNSDVLASLRYVVVPIVIVANGQSDYTFVSAYVKTEFNPEHLIDAFLRHQSGLDVSRENTDQGLTAAERASVLASFKERTPVKTTDLRDTVYFNYVVQFELHGLRQLNAGYPAAFNVVDLPRGCFSAIFRARKTLLSA
jgi:hypothetical protein